MTNSVEKKCREVYVLIGPSGSGKTTWTKSFKQKFGDSFVIGDCSADRYFVDQSGSYKFDGRKLGAAHKACIADFQQMLANDYDIVIVDNTNLRSSDRQIYISTAEEFGYTIIFVKFFSRYENIHGVPKEKVDEMIQRFNSSECDLPVSHEGFVYTTIDVKQNFDWLNFVPPVVQ